VVTRRDDGTVAVLFDGFETAADAVRVTDLVAARLRRLPETDGGALGIAVSEPRDRSPQVLLDRALACLVQTADQ